MMAISEARFGEDLRLRHKNDTMRRVYELLQDRIAELEEAPPQPRM
jgi:hypothetical protein